MAAVPNYKEQIHQELFDTLVRNNGVTTVAQRTKLFRALNTGNPELTNMLEGGRLSNEETFLLLTIRFYVQFATSARYAEIEDGIMWTLFVGNKSMLGPIPLFCAPAGGGMFGYDVGLGAHVIGNGVPSWQSILMLAKPIKIEKNEHFSVDTEFYTFAVGAGGGGAGAINPLTNLNADVTLKIIKAFIGGILERPVQ
jgi:hypothetical protein